MVGCELQGMLKTRTRRDRLARACLQHTQVVPAVGVVGLQTQRLVLFVDRLLQLSGSRQNLRNQRVQIRIAGLKLHYFAQLLQRIARPAWIAHPDAAFLTSLESYCEL